MASANDGCSSQSQPTLYLSITFVFRNKTVAGAMEQHRYASSSSFAREKKSEKTGFEMSSGGADRCQVLA